MPNIGNIRTGLGTFGEQIQEAIWTSQHRPQGRAAYHPRTPWVVSCRSWMERKKSISLYCNPRNAQWRLGRRGTTVKTAAGTIRNVWKNQFRGTYYDEGEVTLTFQAGNILPIMGNIGRGEPAAGESVKGFLAQGGAPPGLQNFYDFLALLNEPQTLGPAENRHILVYHSRAFPRLYLEGFFKDEDPITFSEVSDESGANTVEWTATFVIYSSSPRLDSLNASDLASTYRTWMQGDGASESIPSGLAASAAAEQVLSTVQTVGSPSLPPAQGTNQTGNGKTSSGSKPPPAPAAPGSSVTLPAGSGAAAATQVTDRTKLMLGG